MDIKKLEAIDRVGLGEKEDNLNTIADLESKILKIEADKVKIRAKIATNEVLIKDQKKQIEEQMQRSKEWRLISKKFCPIAPGFSGLNKKGERYKVRFTILKKDRQG